HGEELERDRFATEEEGAPRMSHDIHESHSHRHGTGCGHKRIQHEGHEDFLHDGCMHHVHGDHVCEHAVAVGPNNPESCTPKHACRGNANDHSHGPGCGHDAVPHGQHVDYLVEGHLHHPCAGHCDDHGRVRVA